MSDARAKNQLEASEQLALGDTVQQQVPEVHADEPANSVSLEDAIRIMEAVLFVSDAPVTRKVLGGYIGDAHVDEAVKALEGRYASGGIRLMRLADGFALRTAPDLDWLFEAQAREPRKLSRAGLETLAIIAYHQPVTRAEIEEIRGVAASKGTLDVLLESGWVRMRGRRRTPGRPVTYGTTPAFLDQFTLASIGDLPSLEELKGAGLLDAVPDPGSPMLPGLGDAEAIEEDPIDEQDARAERASMALWPSEDAGEASAEDGRDAADGIEDR